MGNSQSNPAPIAAASSPPVSSSSPPTGCPVAHTRKAGASPTGCPVAHQKPSATEPPTDRPDHIATSTHSSVYTAAPATPAALEAGLHPIGELTPEGAIPAAGRGNSEDGRNWVNPSPNQLYRALHRKEKGISPTDVFSVSTVHEFITAETWHSIMKYERRHKEKCENPTLARFYGMDGIYSMKSRLLRLTGAPIPFDRHDWIVDRCGQEVRYIIDYYSSEEKNHQTGEVDISYFIDARPAPNLRGLYERMRVSVEEYRNGEKWW